MTNTRKRKLNWFYIPAVVIMLTFIAYPLCYAVYLSFFKWNGYSVNKDFVGISNYISMFKDKVFISSLRNTLVYGFVCTLLQQVIGLAMAMFLNTKFKGRGIVRTVIYMPAMISGLVMGYIMYFFFQFKGGVINDIMASLGMAGYDWLGNGASAIGDCLHQYMAVRGRQYGNLFGRHPGRVAVLHRGGHRGRRVSLGEIPLYYPAPVDSGAFIVRDL